MFQCLQEEVKDFLQHNSFTRFLAENETWKWTSQEIKRIEDVHSDVLKLLDLFIQRTKGDNGNSKK